jgi:hypothetical protein
LKDDNPFTETEQKSGHAISRRPMHLTLISAHCYKAEIHPCEDILCPIDISEKDAKYGSLMVMWILPDLV